MRISEDRLRRAMLKRATELGVESLIRGWLLSLKRNPRTTHLDDHNWGAYYWNERDYQWALLAHMKDTLGAKASARSGAFTPRVRGSGPRYARKSAWSAKKRSDIVIVNHRDFLRWWKAGRVSVRDFPVEVAIEMKISWGASEETRSLIQADISKLGRILRDRATKSAYLVWLDSIRGNGSRKGRTFFSPQEIQEMRRGTGLKIFHWPDGDDPILGTGGQRRIETGFDMRRLASILRVERSTAWSWPNLPDKVRGALAQLEPRFARQTAASA